MIILFKDIKTRIIIFLTLLILVGGSVLYLNIYNVGAASYTKRISVSTDDAEQLAVSPWTMKSLSSSDLELHNRVGNADGYVGMRFIGITIPQGATIDSAKIQFHVDEVRADSALTVTFRGEDVDNAVTFTSADKDISNRTVTTASVDWAIPSWDAVHDEGSNQLTTDLKTIVQEIVDRGSWSSGNAMVIMIKAWSGSGQRVAESSDGDGGGSGPEITITYTIAAPPPPQTGNNVSGWAWSPVSSYNNLVGFKSGFGLTSFSDCYLNGDPPCIRDYGGIPYGLTIDLVDSEIFGWTWSSSVGWMCFGGSCCRYNALTCPHGGFSDYDTGRPALAENPNLEVKYSGVQDPLPITGWAKIISWPNDKGWLSLRGNFNGPAGQYGLRFSTTTLEIEGLAWNGFEDPGAPADPGRYKGYSWFCINEQTEFSPLDPNLCCFRENPITHECLDGGVQVSVPFLQTTDGDVYVRGGITPDYAPPGGYFNATYLILAGGTINNFISEEVGSTFGSGEYVIPNFPTPLGLPRADQNYFNILGLLDVDGLLVESDNEYGTYGGKYASGETINDAFSVNGKRIIIDGDAYLDTVTYDIDYAGVTFIVDGDLYVLPGASVVYDSVPVTNFANLPSVSFIVLGDMFIDPSITQLAGNFVVLGDKDGPACPAVDCGAIHTGASSLNALTSYGIMMARQFVLERLAADIVNTPSEKIIYDGRLLVNPPPGFKNLSKGLPVFTQIAPQ